MNVLRSTSLALLGVFAALLSSTPERAGAAPTASRTTPTVQSACKDSAPTSAKQCASIVQGAAYLDTACGKKYADTCKQLFEQRIAKYKQSFDKKKPPDSSKIKLLTGGNDVPKNLRDGYRMQSYAGPKTGKSLAVPGKNALARSGLTRPAVKSALLAAQAATAHRNPSWDQNGEKITSCEEFAYEELYDRLRFADAVAACSGDYGCEMDVAYMTSTPGVVGRTLMRKDGTKIRTRYLTHDGKWTSTVPKAEGGIESFVEQMGYWEVMTDANFASAKQHATWRKNDLFTTLAARAAMVGDWTKMSNTWDLGTMLRTGPMSAHPSQEIPQPPPLKEDGSGSKHPYVLPSMPKTDETKALVRTLRSGRKYYQIDGCKTGCGTKRFEDEWAFHRALQERTANVSEAEWKEYERRKHEYRELVQQVLAAMAWYDDMTSQHKPSIEDPVPSRGYASRIDLVSNNPMQQMTELESRMSKFGTGIQQAAEQNAQQYGALAATGVLAAPTAKKTKPTNPATVAKKPTKIVFPDCDPRNWGTEEMGLVADAFWSGPATCALGKFMRQEWARKKRGQVSCLDLDRADCDWTPKVFHDRFIAGYTVAASQSYLEDTCNTYGGVGKSKKDLAAAETQIAKTYKALAEVLEDLAPYDDNGTAKVGGKTFKKLGKSWSDGEYAGDKDWFGAGYDYSLGWEVHPAKVDDGKACRLQGEVSGGLGVDATFIGMNVAIIDGAASAKFNSGNDGKFDVDAHLTILVDELFHVDKSDYNHALSEKWSNGIDVPGYPHPSFQFMAGPVPITGAVWAELMYGASFAVHHSIGKCDADDVDFSLHGVLSPEVGLDARAQAGVGIAGLISAGVRIGLNLVTVGLPFDVGIDTKKGEFAGQKHVSKVEFDAEIGLSLASLSGYLSLYFEVLFASLEFELFSWTGVDGVIALMNPLHTEVPAYAWPESK